MSLLVIESNDESIKASIVKRTFKGCVLSNSIKFQRENEYEMITEDEIRIVKMMMRKHPKKVVIVNSSVMLMEVFMNKDVVSSMNSRQLKEAVKWEVEQYVPDNIVGYEVCNVSASDVEDEGQVRIWVSVIPQDDYDSLKQILLREGLVLKNVYPSDVCYPMVKEQGDSIGGMVALNINEKSIKMTYLNNKKLVRFRDIPIGSEDINFSIKNQTTSEIKDIISEAFEQICLKDNDFRIREISDMQVAAAQLDIEKELVTLSGVGVADPMVVNVLKSAIQRYINIVDIKTDEDVGEKGLVITEFANIYGAGIRQLSLDWRLRSIGVNDLPDILTLIKQKPQIVPLAITGMLIIVFGLNYSYMTYKVYKNDKEITELERIKSNYESLQANYSSLEDQKEEALEDMHSNNEKIHFLSKDIDIRREYIVNLLRGIKSSSNLGVKIYHVEPDDMDGMQFNVRGESDNVASVNRLITGLQSQEWCQYARLIHMVKGIKVTEKQEDITTTDSVDENGEEVTTTVEAEPPVIIHTFSLKVVLN